MSSVGSMTIMVAGDVSQLHTSMMAGAKSIAQLERQAASLSASLLDEERTLRMGAAAAMDYKLALAGVDKETRAALISRRQVIADLKAEAEATAAAERAKIAAMGKGAMITASVMTATEKYATEIAELNVLLKQGAISQETYARAAHRAKDAMSMSRRLGDLKNQFGARGPLKGLLDVAVGGGAFAGIQFATQMLGQAATKANEVATAYRLGEKSAGEMADEIARQLPYLGGIYTAGRAIRNIFTAESAELAKINKLLETRNALMDAATKFKTDQTEYRKGIDEDIERMRYEARAAKIAGIDNSTRRADAQFQNDFAEESRRIKKAAVEQVDKATKEWKIQLVRAQRMQGSLRMPDAPVQKGTKGPNLNPKSQAEYEAAVKEFHRQYAELQSTINTAQGMIDQETRLTREKTDQAVEAVRNKLLAGPTPNVGWFFSELPKQIRQYAREFEQSARFFIDNNPLTEWAKRVKEDVKTPVEKYEEMIRKLRLLFVTGLIDQETFNRASLKARDEMASEVKKDANKPDIKLSFASTSDAEIGRGVTTAIANMASAQIGGQVERNLQKATVEELKKILKQQEELNKKLKVGS